MIMEASMNVSINLPQSEFAILKKKAKALGWNLIVEQEEHAMDLSERNKMVERLYGCIQLPDDFDYKVEKAKYLSEKYKL